MSMKSFIGVGVCGRVWGGCRTWGLWLWLRWMKIVKGLVPCRGG